MAHQEEKLLLDAGFEERAIQSGERDLPARQMVTRYDGENTWHLYADPAGCHCVYAGATPAYERYRWLKTRENVLRELDGDAMNVAGATRL